MCCRCLLSRHYLPQQRPGHRKKLHQRATAASLRANRITNQLKNYGMYVERFYIKGPTQKQEHIFVLFIKKKYIYNSKTIA